MAKDVYYFPHESTAHSDPKITKLLLSLKAEGYGIYWVIIEMLRNEETLSLSNTDYDAIAYQSHSDSKIVEKVIKDFGLFVVSDNGSFYSESLVRRVELYREKSKKYSANAHKRWDNDAIAMPRQCDGNALKERKGKEISTTSTQESSPIEIYKIFEESVLDLWNTFVTEFPTLSRVKEITGKRREKLKKRFEAKSFRDFSLILEAIKAQEFLLGRNDRSWVVSFDWLIENDTNYMKILENKYQKPSKETFESPVDRLTRIVKEGKLHATRNQ